MTASENKADLIADFRRMINNPDFCDLTFSCKDGIKIHASRIVLKARSGSNKLSIQFGGIQNPVAHITSSTLLAILEFLHTGDMVQYSPFSLKQAEEIIQASKDLELPAVEKSVTELRNAIMRFDELNVDENIADAAIMRFDELNVDENIADTAIMRSDELNVDENIADAALQLSVALEAGTTANASNVNPARLVQILSAADLKPGHLRYLSVKAFEYYLDQTQSKTDPGSPSFREFIRFRQVILWCVTQICPNEAAEVVAKALLDAEPLDAKPDREREYLKTLLTKRKKQSGQKDHRDLLGLIDYRRIHAKLLKEVVKPLKVVPAGKILDAYEFHALEKPPQYIWEHGSSYRCIGKNKSVIAKSNSGVGFARFSMPVHRDYGVYEWAIVVEELCDGFCEIGFYKVDGLQESEFTGTSLSEQPTGRALCSDYMRNRERRTRINQRGGHNERWEPFKKHLEGSNPRVNIKLNMDRGICYLSVDGDEYLEAWRDLPFPSVFYPAVSLGNGIKGKVRIELISGF